MASAAPSDAGGAGIVLGIATYGYKIIRVIGVKMVHLTFARGFAVELGAAIVIVVASRYGLPVSSTQVSCSQRGASNHFDDVLHDSVLC